MVTAFLVAFSAVFGAAEAIRHTQSSAKRKEHRSRKNNLLIQCRKSTRYFPELHGKRVVLSGDKLFADTGLNPDMAFGHPFTGYFLPYPDSLHSGLVSTICEEPPIMNWIYVDRETYEVKFGTRPYAQPNLTGPFDCTRQDKRLTFAGWEGFFLVKMGMDDFWALYFDVEQDRLKSKLGESALALEVDLLRVEMPIKPVKEEETEEETEADQPEGRGAGQEFRQAGASTSGQESQGSNAAARGLEVELESPEVD